MAFEASQRAIRRGALNTPAFCQYPDSNGIGAFQ
jgi:hypothetical protein